MSTLPQPATRTPSTGLNEAARAVSCPQCWAVPGTDCQRHPAGQHIARYCRAYKDGRLTEAGMTAVFDAAVVITNATVIPAVTS